LIQSHPFVICEKGRCRSWTTWPPPRSPPRLRTSTPSGLKLSSNWRAPSRRRCLPSCGLACSLETPGRTGSSSSTTIPSSAAMPLSPSL
jgi:hypothetical protein